MTMKIRWTLPYEPTSEDVAVLTHVLPEDREVIHDPLQFKNSRELVEYIDQHEGEVVVVGQTDDAGINALIRTTGKLACIQADHDGMPLAVFYRDNTAFKGIVRIFPTFKGRVGAKELSGQEVVKLESSLDPDPDADLVGAEV